MTKRPSPEMSESLKSTREYLVRSIAKDKLALFSPGEAADLVENIDALTAERDLLKERLGPAGAEEIVRLKIYLTPESFEHLERFGGTTISCALKPFKGAIEFVALAKPGEEIK